MAERKKTESTSGRSSAGTSTGRRSPTQSNRLTYEAVRTTIGTRQASLLERKALPPISKQAESELLVVVAVIYLSLAAIFEAILLKNAF